MHYVGRVLGIPPFFYHICFAMSITDKVIFIAVHICFILTSDAKKVGNYMLEYSDTLGRWYQSEEMVFFRNLVQGAYYIHHGAKLQDIFTDSNGKLVLVFSKEDHKKLIGMWNDNKRNKELFSGGAENA